MIIFNTGHMPVVIAADIFGKDASWIRAGLVNGWLPIGIATYNGQKVIGEVDGRINYYISPKAVSELTGYLWEGKEV